MQDEANFHAGGAGFFEEETVFSRTELLIGHAALEKLNRAHVIVFGLGGVGGSVSEALCRAGVGNLTLVDNDTVSLSNINRQIFALHSTLGKKKVLAAHERLLDINPDCKITVRDIFFLLENKSAFDFSVYDYVVDAVDTVAAKIAIIECAKAANVRVISSMGTGNKLHAERFRIADIAETSVCPLARIVRSELRKRNIRKVKVLFSDESPVLLYGKARTRKSADNKNAGDEIAHGANIRTQKKAVPASISFVPNIAGLLIAGEVIRDLLSEIT